MSIEIVLSDTPLTPGRMVMTFMEDIPIKAEIAVDVITGDTVIRIPLKENDEAFKEKAMECLQTAADEL